MPLYDAFSEHYPCTRTERAVLRQIACGETDAEIAVTLNTARAAVHSCVRRFRDRTGLAGRALTVWAVCTRAAVWPRTLKRT